MTAKIGQYELGKTLGTGNFSKVKLATDTESGTKWAIKIIDKAQLAKEHMEEQLKREIAVMKQLKAPNIVQLREVMQTTNHIYIVLELVTGGELFDKIVQAKKFDENTARRYFHQLITGIYYCHQQGVAHRDLKPENLLLDGNDTLKISDFGLSNLQRGGASGQGTLLQTVCGTPNYVAPEVLREKGYNGIMADCWSCGIVLFVMLAGYLPFDDSNMNALFNKIERGEYRMARHFSDSVKDLISKMLNIDPKKRITIDEVIAHPWFQVGFNASNFVAITPENQVHVTSQQMNSAIVDAVQPSTKSSAPVANQDGAAPTLNPKSSTRFLFAGAQQELTEVLKVLDSNPRVKESTLEVKGFVNAPKGLLTYTAVVTPTNDSGLTLIEFRRGRGDVFEFHELYRNVVKVLGNRVRGGEIATAQ